MTADGRLPDLTADVLVVGAGPAGLAAAVELRRLGIEGVLVVDREREAGGVPRHCAHTGYGVRDLRRLMTGPAYARHYAAVAAAAGAEIKCRTTGTSIGHRPGPAGSRGTLLTTLTSPAGGHTVGAMAIIVTSPEPRAPDTHRPGPC